MLAELEYIPHYAYLLSTLYDIRLVDAYSVDP
jgi:hypothetical protein